MEEEAEKASGSSDERLKYPGKCAPAELTIGVLATGSYVRTYAYTSIHRCTGTYIYIHVSALITIYIYTYTHIYIFRYVHTTSETYIHV